MRCLSCQNNKPYNEFVDKNLTTFCTHPPYVCLRCYCDKSKVEQSDGEVFYRCPAIVSGVLCGKTITDDDDDSLVEQMKEILDILYPPLTDETSSINFGDDGTNSVIIQMIDGSRQQVSIEKCTKLPALAEAIERKTGISINKQALYKDEVQLQLYTDQAERKLSDYDITSGTLLTLFVRFGYIPQYVSNVTFALSADFKQGFGQWLRGKTDHLNISCHAYSSSGMHTAIKSSSPSNSYCVLREGILSVSMNLVPRYITRFFFAINTKKGTRINNFEKIQLNVRQDDNPPSVSDNVLTEGRRKAKALVVCAMTRDAGGGWDLFLIGKKVGNPKNDKEDLEKTLEDATNELNRQGVIELKSLAESTDTKDPRNCTLQ